VRQTYKYTHNISKMFTVKKCLSLSSHNEGDEEQRSMMSQDRSSSSTNSSSKSKYKKDSTMNLPGSSNGSVGNDQESKSETTPKDQQLSDQVEQKEISQKESRSVNQLRSVVFFALLAASIVVSVIVFLITSTGEKNEFESQYDGMSNQIITTFHEIVTRNFGVLGALRVSLMAHGIDHETPWPYVTLSSFSKRVASVLRLSNTLYLGVYPLVKELQRVQWNEYVQVEGKKWM
jgi:hypothetical protein